MSANLAERAHLVFDLTTKRRLFSVIGKNNQVMLLWITEKILSAFLQGQKAFCEWRRWRPA